jgi:putative NADPH-quinone reductase
MTYPFEPVPEPSPRIRRRVLVLFAHPVPTSFQATLHRRVVETLRDCGHQVDDCDLYAEGFPAVLSRQERLDYHDTGRNRRNVADYVSRLLAADALVLVFPVWIFGVPAIMKGFFDRVLVPGVMFDLVDGQVKMKLHNIRKVTGIATYGGSRLRATLAGDPPRKTIKRVIRAMVHPAAPVTYLAQYAMDRTSFIEREHFIARVQNHMERF